MPPHRVRACVRLEPIGWPGSNGRSMSWPPSRATAEAADRLARLWQMVADLDPELSRRMARLTAAPRTCHRDRHDRARPGRAWPGSVVDAAAVARGVLALERRAAHWPGDLDVERGAAPRGAAGPRPGARPTVLIGLRDLDPALVQVGTARGDAPRRRCPPALTEPNSRPLAPARRWSRTVSAASVPGRGLGVVQAADVAGRAGPLDQLDLLLGAAGPPHGEARAGPGSCGRSRPRPRPRRRGRPGR